MNCVLLFSCYSYFKAIIQGVGEDFVGKIFAAQVLRPEFSSPVPTKSQM